MKKTNTPNKKLKLKKETIRTLDPKEMEQVKGAGRGYTIECSGGESLNGGNNHNQTFLRRRGR